MVILHNMEVMIIGGWPTTKSVIIYNGNSSTVGSFTDANDLLFSPGSGMSCTLFNSKKHNSRPVVLLVSSSTAQIYDYTVADSWEQSKFYLKILILYSNKENKTYK